MSYRAIAFFSNNGTQYVFYSMNEENKLHNSSGPSILSFFEFPCECGHKVDDPDTCQKQGFYSVLKKIEEGEVDLRFWSYHMVMMFHLDGVLKNKFVLEDSDKDGRIKFEEGSIECQEIKVFFNMKEFLEFADDKGLKDAIEVDNYYDEGDVLSDEQIEIFMTLP